MKLDINIPNHKSILSWISDYQFMRKNGNVKGAKLIKVAIDKAIINEKLEANEMYFYNGDPDSHKTKVIFRKFKSTGEVIALFPELPGTSDYTTCESYMHTGQHGSASVSLSAITVRATEEDIKPLKRELEVIGYNLEVVNRFSTLHFDARVRAINEVKR